MERETVVGEAPDGKIWACYTKGATLAQHYREHARLAAELIERWKRYAQGEAKRKAR